MTDTAAAVRLAPGAEVGGSDLRVHVRDDVRQLYAEEYDGLTGFAYRMVGDVDAAGDIVQEAFTRLLSRWVQVRAPVPFLFRTITNLARDGWRAQSRDQRLTDALAPAMGQHVPPADHGVRDAVARLPRAERDVVVLFYFADLPVERVAEILGKPPGTVKWLLSAAREHLAVSLGDFDA